MDTHAIDAANAKLEALQKAGNASGICEMYTQDAVLLPSGGPKAAGSRAIEAFWAKAIGSGVGDLKLTTEDLVPVRDDLLYEIGSYTMTPKDGSPVSGHYLVLWKQVGGTWKLHVDIFNEAPSLS